jgi:hypothetical protein
LREFACDAAPPIVEEQITWILARHVLMDGDSQSHHEIISSETVLPVR